MSFPWLPIAFLGGGGCCFDWPVAGIRLPRAGPGAGRTPAYVAMTEGERIDGPRPVQQIDPAHPPTQNALYQQIQHRQIPL